jgi:NAD-dependent deacetylase
MPQDKMHLAERSSKECDLIIVVGSSLVVFPAAGMPLIAKQAGAKLVIINYTPTDMDSQADVVVHAKAGNVMKTILEKVKQKSADA